MKPVLYTERSVQEMNCFRIINNVITSYSIHYTKLYDTPKILYRFIFANAIQKALLIGTFWKMGYKKNNWINMAMVKMSSDKKRKKWLQKIERRFSLLNK